MVHRLRHSIGPKVHKDTHDDAAWEDHLISKRYVCGGWWDEAHISRRITGILRISQCIHGAIITRSVTDKIIFGGVNHHSKDPHKHGG